MLLKFHQASFEEETIENFKKFSLNTNSETIKFIIIYNLEWDFNVALIKIACTHPSSHKCIFKLNVASHAVSKSHFFMVKKYFVTIYSCSFDHFLPKWIFILHHTMKNYEIDIFKYFLDQCKCIFTKSINYAKFIGNEVLFLWPLAILLPHNHLCCITWFHSTMNSF